VGRELRLRQRRRGRAAVRLARQRLHARRRVDERARACCASPTRLVVRQPRRHADLGQPLRLTDSTSAGPGRMALWPTNSAQTHQRRRLHEARASHQITGFVSFGLLEETPAASAVHDQSHVDARLLRAHVPTARRISSHQHQPGLSADKTTVSFSTRSATTTTAIHTPQRGRSRVSSTTTTFGDTRPSDGGPGALRGTIA
jgi:hypothetical protein